MAKKVKRAGNSNADVTVPRAVPGSSEGRTRAVECRVHVTLQAVIIVADIIVVVFTSPTSAIVNKYECVYFYKEREGRTEGNVLFNDALNTFYLRQSMVNSLLIKTSPLVSG